MLTNLDHTDHKKAPTLFGEQFILEKTQERIAQAQNQRINNDNPSIRDFNIINNRYYHNREERQKEEFEEMKKHVLNKYWKTHDYDLLKVEYYDANKEEKYWEQKKFVDSVRGAARQAKLPPALQYCDGNSYNIVNHDIFDEMKLKATNNVDQRSLNRIKRMAREEEVRESGENNSAIEEAQRLNKISYQRWGQQLERGYNMITNELNLNPPAPLPKRPQSMWSKLTEQTISHESNRQSTAIPPSSSRFKDLSGNLTTKKSFYVDQSQSAQGERAQRSLLSSPAKQGYDHMQSSRLAPSNERSGRGNAISVPSLDLTRAEGGETVSYNEPLKGHAGQAVPMVRTGGFSGLHSK
jgi:hypothetical protein